MFSHLGKWRCVIDFGGKTVLVTGGGAGIGLATVRRFAELGAAPAVLEVDADLASALRDELRPDSLGVRNGGTLAAAGWYRDDRGRWTNMPVIRGNSAVAADAGT